MIMILSVDFFWGSGNSIVQQILGCAVSDLSKSGTFSQNITHKIVVLRQWTDKDPGYIINKGD